MRIQAKVLAIKNNLMKIEVAQPQKFRVNDKVSVVKGSQRTVNQNSFYWKYLQFVIENGAEEHGHFCPMGLHISLKQRILANKSLTKGEWKDLEESTTTNLSKMEFSNYMEKVDNLVVEFLGVDTSSFFEDYQNIYKPEWK